MKNRIAVTILLSGAALVVGCAKKTPAGQVAATVNGEEVTIQEINTELQAANIPPTADKQTVQRAILQRVIERKLLVAQAHDKGLDQTPDFLAQRRRADELLLVQTLARQQLANVAVPATAEVDKFMADNPAAFVRREQWVLDQIRFPTPPNPNALAPLRSANTMEEVQAALIKLGIRFERGTAGLDTAQLPPQDFARINAAPASEPIVIPQGGVMTVNIIKERRPIPLDQAQARPAAVQAWRQRKFAETLNKEVQQLKTSAQISYQNGFGPPPAPTGALGGPPQTPANGATPKAP